MLSGGVHVIHPSAERPKLICKTSVPRALPLGNIAPLSSGLDHLRDCAVLVGAVADFATPELRDVFCSDFRSDLEQAKLG